jgi:hypothetical protein
LIKTGKPPVLPEDWQSLTISEREMAPDMAAGRRLSLRKRAGGKRELLEFMALAMFLRSRGKVGAKALKSNQVF